MHKKTLVIYQNIDSGAKVVTEEIVGYFESNQQLASLITHKQNPQQYVGSFSALKNFVWSGLDCARAVFANSKQVEIIYTPYYLAALIASLLKKKTQIVVFHFHGDHAITHIPVQKGWLGNLKYLYIYLFGTIISGLQKAALARSNLLIFVSEQAYQHIQKTYALPKSSTQIVIAPNGVSNTIFHPATTPREKKAVSQLRKKLKINDQEMVILYSGRIDEKKGIHQILKALKMLQQSHQSKTVRCIIMHPSYRDKDSTKYAAMLKSYVRRHALAVNFVSQPQTLAPYYQLADMCILPSEQEMMPLVMLESLACGTPFFGTNQGNMGQLLPRINPHLLLPNNHPTSIVTAIQWWQQLSFAQKQLLHYRCTKEAAKYTWKKTIQTVFSAISQTFERNQLPLRQ